MASHQMLLSGGSDLFGVEVDSGVYTLNHAHNGVYMEEINEGEKKKAANVLMLLSIGCLLPWYAVIASSAYIRDHIPHSPQYLQWTVSVAFVVATQVGAMVVVFKGTRPHFTHRIVLSCAVCSIIVVAIPWVPVTWLAMVLVAVLGLMASLQLLTVYGLAGQLGSGYMKPISLGTGLAGVVVVALSIINSVLVYAAKGQRDTSHTTDTSNIIVLVTFTSIYLLLCLAAYYYVLHGSEILQCSLDRAADAHTVTDILNSNAMAGSPFLVLSPKRVFFKVHQIMLALCINYTVTLGLILGWGAHIASECQLLRDNKQHITCGILLIGVAVGFDVIGRVLAYWYLASRYATWLLLAARCIVCITGFALSIRPDLIGDIGSMTIYAVFGFSNGYLHSVLFVNGIRCLTEENRFMGSTFLVLAMLFGITCGVGGAAVLHTWYI